MKEEPLANEELRLFKRRSFIFGSLVGIPFLAFTWRLWSLQIKQGDIYSDLSKGNRIRLKSIPAPRGIIYDREGAVLSKNIPSYNLELTRADAPDMEAVLKKLAKTLNIPFENLLQAIRNDRHSTKFDPIRIYSNLGSRQIALVNAYQEEFPGISIEVTSLRYYPLQKTGAHIYGYMSSINRAQLKKLPPEKLTSARFVGQDGIEAIYNDVLTGTDGGMQVEVHSTGRVFKKLKSIDPIPGNDVELAIDNRLQKRAEAVLGNRKGAVIAMNPNNGEILATVSFPSFDPNEFSQRISYDRWKQLTSDPLKTLHNKCIKGVYAPGSTFKMAVAIAALEMGIITQKTKLQCDGYYRYKRLKVHCHKRSGHGAINVLSAIEQSCNVFFYRLILEIGADNLYTYARKLGLGEPTGVDLSNEASGTIPTRHWKRKTLGGRWYAGDTLPLGIGQGFVSVTPLQLVNYVNIIASGGYLVRPRIVKSILTDYPNIVMSETKQLIERVKEQERKRVDIDSKFLSIAKTGMALNVQSKRGTGRRARSRVVPIAGKTGTAQVVSLKTRDRVKKEKGEIEKRFLDHSWFVGFAPIEKPRFSAVVLIENGGSGSNSTPLFRKIAEYYFTEISALTEEERRPFSLSSLEAPT